MIKILKRVIQGIKYAFEGLLFAFRTDEHFRINAFLGVFMSAVSLLLLDPPLSVVVAFVNYAVFVVELINTAVEKAVDAATKQFSLDAKAAKDVSAAAVLSVGLFAVFIDIMFLLPKLLKLFGLKG